MNLYKPSEKNIWTGRKADQNLYVYQKVEQIDLIYKIPRYTETKLSSSWVMLDEGVKKK